MANPKKAVEGATNLFDMLFLHNTDADKLKRIQQMGGMPMPDMSNPNIIKSGTIPTAGAGALGQILFGEDESQPSSADSMSADDLLKQLQGMK